MPRATWLKDVLVAGGLEVVELAGWRTRGAERLTVNAVVRHHTATGINWTDRAVAELLGLKGNATTPPPLSQLGLDRRGRYWTIAAGRCNHNGYGTFGNDAIGIEAFNNGVGEPWPRVQVDAYDLGVALILEHLGLPTERDLAHRETDPRRKTDPVGLDMPTRRRRVNELRAGFHIPAPPKTTKEYEDMHLPAAIVKGSDDPRWWLTDAITKQHITSTGHAKRLVHEGHAKWDASGHPFVWPQEDIDSVRTVT